MKKPSPFKSINKSIRKSLSRMGRSVSGMGGSLQKTVSQLTRRRPARRHAADQAAKEIQKEAQLDRLLQNHAKRQRRIRKALEERRAAILQALRTGFRIETLRLAMRTPFVRLWAPRLVALVAVVSLIGNVLQYYRYSPWRPLVTVGHRVVRQREYMAALDGAAGKAVLNKIVYEELIQQAATRAGLMPTAQDVDMRLADLRRRSPRSLPPDDQLWDQMQLQMALENLRMRGTTATEAEIADYYAQHKGDFSTPARAQTTLVATTNAADAARAAQMLTADRAESQIAAQPGMHVAGIGGFSVNIDSLPPTVRQLVGQTVMALPVGSVKTIQIAPKVFFTLKPQGREEGQVTPLPLVRQEVARRVRLLKAPNDQAELITLYRANPPSFDMAKYGSYFSDMPTASPPPSGPKTASLPPAGAQ